MPSKPPSSYRKIFKTRWEDAEDVVHGIKEYFPYIDNVRNLVLSEYQVPKTIDFPGATRKYFSQIDAKNLIYVLSDMNNKGSKRFLHIELEVCYSILFGSEKFDQTDPLTSLKYTVKKLDENFLNMLNALEPATSETYASVQVENDMIFPYI